MALAIIAKDIKLSHSIFALPFVAAGLILSDIEMPSLTQIVLLILCMITARTFAMCSNRILDRNIDAQNNRTASRALPSGRVTLKSYASWASLSALIFIWGSFQLNSQAGWYSFPLLAILATYSLMKRISWLTHWYLGLCLALAPIAAIIALSGEVSPSLYLLSLSIIVWTAGFDIIYALQDISFDKKMSLKSYPAKFGVKNSLMVSKLCFFIMISTLFTIGILENSKALYFIGIFLVGGFLWYEHRLVKGLNYKNEIRIEAAFFTMNAYVSLIYLIFLQLDVWLLK